MYFIDSNNQWSVDESLQTHALIQILDPPLRNKPFLSGMIFYLLFHDCCRIQNADLFTVLYNDVLYKIEKLSFTKDSLEKKKQKYQISEY